MKNEESAFIGHEPCPKCGSSDALSRYSDGHGWCFGCETHFPGDGERAKIPITGKTP